MPNQYQLAFLATFFAVFLSLVAAFHTLTAWLDRKGYPIGNLILIGLDETSPKMATGRVQVEQIPRQLIDFVKNFSLEDARNSLTKDNLLELASSPAVIVGAVLLVGSAAYIKALSAGPAKPPLDPNEWKEFPLAHTNKVSPNTAIYRFKLPRADNVLGLPIGQHISVTAEINGKAVIRNYTPVSLPDDNGYFDLLIKTYEKGNISRYVTTLNPGDKLRVKGPKGNFKYTPNLVSHLGMIAGGTGIAPMIQIIRAVLRNPEDKTTISLLYANVNEADILLHKELQDLEAAHSKRFKIFYVLNNPPAGWTGGVGFVTKEHIQTYLQNPGETSSKILICGPPPMVAAMKKNLDELKYPLPNTISKLPDPVFVF